MPESATIGSFVPQKTTVGIVQVCALTDVTANLHICAELVSQAADQGAEVVFLPESFAFIGPDREQREHVETFDNPGPIIESCVQMATENCVHLIAGGFPEDAGDSKWYNTCFHVSPEGEIVERYRKIHLFDVDLEDGTFMHESKWTDPGSRAITTELPFGKLGLSICYDLRFPQLYQKLVDHGAIALAAPAAFMATTGKAHWYVLLRARAVECQSYVIAPAQYGDHFYRGRKSFGHSLVIDPWGRIVTECEQDSSTVAVAEIDPQRVHSVRTQLPSLKNRGKFQ